MSFSILDSVAFDNALDRYYSSMLPEEANCPPLIRCPHCGKRLSFDNSDVLKVYYCPDGYVHRDCFKAYMDATYGEGNWRECEDDGLGGYYEYQYLEYEWEGTGIYYTEFEYADDSIIDWDAIKE